MCSLLHTRFPFAMAFIFIVLVSVGLAYGELNYFDNATADNLTLAAYNIGKFNKSFPCPVLIFYLQSVENIFKIVNDDLFHIFKIQVKQAHISSHFPCAQ